MFFKKIQNDCHDGRRRQCIKADSENKNKHLNLAFFYEKREEPEEKKSPFVTNLWIVFIQ